MTDHLAKHILDALHRPVLPEIAEFAATLAATGDSVAGVLFYGSCLRDASVSGVLDFYVLVDDYRQYHRSRMAAMANAVLPPTVSFAQSATTAGPCAKVAVISLRQFARRMRCGSIDTTLWARFCQPAALVHVRDEATAVAIADALADAAATAAAWAVRLGPEQGYAADYWTGLFRHTYGAELRVEKAGRPRLVYDFAADHFDRLLMPALARAGITVEETPAGTIRPRLSPDERRAGRRAWHRRRRAGKALNVARLVKAAFTFDNAVDYIVWKIERHAGQPIELRPWQRRHPVLAAPALLWRLYRRGMVR